MAHMLVLLNTTKGNNSNSAIDMSSLYLRPTGWQAHNRSHHEQLPLVEHVQSSK